jgi:hypothetical protein
MELRHSGSIQHKDLLEYTDEELLQIVISAAGPAAASRTIDAAPEEEARAPAPREGAVIRLMRPEH